MCTEATVAMGLLVVSLLSAVTLASAYPGGSHYACSAAVAESQYQSFAKGFNTSRRPLHCPEHSWMRLLAEHSHPGHKVYVDVGCNKGYEVAKVLNLWAPKVNITAPGICEMQSWFRNQSTCVIPGMACGACYDCRDPVESVTALNSGASIPTTLDVHCFEASNTSATYLRAMRDRWVPANNTLNVTWNVYNKAVGDRKGTISFPKECSSETCAITRAAANTVVMPLTSIDVEMSNLRLTYIDMLKIDTEGNDPGVLLGAMKALKEHRIGMMQFEYHLMGMWATVSLEGVVRSLSKVNMVCYMAYGKDLYRLTGCWHKGYEFKTWSNVVCIHAGHFLYHIMDSRSVHSVMMGLACQQDPTSHASCAQREKHYQH